MELVRSLRKPRDYKLFDKDIKLKQQIAEAVAYRDHDKSYRLSLQERQYEEWHEALKERNITSEYKKMVPVEANIIPGFYLMKNGDFVQVGERSLFGVSISASVYRILYYPVTNKKNFVCMKSARGIEAVLNLLAFSEMIPITYEEFEYSREHKSIPDSLKDLLSGEQ